MVESNPDPACPGSRGVGAGVRRGRKRRAREQKSTLIWPNDSANIAHCDFPDMLSWVIRGHQSEQHLLRKRSLSKYVATDMTGSNQVSTEASAVLRLRALAHSMRWKLIDLLE